jgi:hypothetical protein
MAGNSRIELMTLTLTEPAAPAGVTAMSVLLLTKVTWGESAAPNLTRQPFRKSCPMMVT